MRWPTLVLLLTPLVNSCEMADLGIASNPLVKSCEMADLGIASDHHGEELRDG